jgi:hypothetical protein
MEVQQLETAPHFCGGGGGGGHAVGQAMVLVLLVVHGGAWYSFFNNRFVSNMMQVVEHGALIRI